MKNQAITDLVDYLNQHDQIPLVLTDCSENQAVQALYEQKRQVFNRKFDFRPLAIVLVENTEQVSLIVKFASQHKLEITVRSGGHDHEGESVATAKLLLDFSKMNSVEVSETGEGKRVAIEPGARFYQIKPVLDQRGLAIAHGTCRTVAIAGYTLGGGWGPWTRKHGMGCERLIAATIVLGDGEICHLNIEQPSDSKEGRLLYALRGGGGLSYGIVTQMVFEPFELPDMAFSYSINSNQCEWFKSIPAVKIIEAWERAIAYDNNPGLIGTNLKICAKGLKPAGCARAKETGEAQQPDPMACLDWQFNGHFAGSRKELEAMLLKWFSLVLVDTDKQKLQIVAPWLQTFLSGDKQLRQYDRAQDRQYPLNFEGWDRQNGRHSHIELETDLPAPHKITSKLAERGWNEQSRQALVCSMQSPHLYETDSKSNVSAYFTLGAISGEYYRDHPNGGARGSSFPYKDCLFTIQYQAWWDQTEVDKAGDKVPPKLVEQTRCFENRAQDWIESARDHDIPHTRGAFISFKDASIATSTYFDQNYQYLKAIKIRDSQDPHCLLRSRKTII